MQRILKKMLFVFGLIAILSSITQEMTDAYALGVGSASQVTKLQSDKDNHRDVGDAVALSQIKQFPIPSVVASSSFYADNYQEPTLSAKLRPPKA